MATSGDPSRTLTNPRFVKKSKKPPLRAQLVPKKVPYPNSRGSYPVRGARRRTVLKTAPPGGNYFRNSRGSRGYDSRTFLPTGGLGWGGGDGVLSPVSAKVYDGILINTRTNLRVLVRRNKTGENRDRRPNDRHEVLSFTAPAPVFPARQGRFGF